MDGRQTDVNTHTPESMLDTPPHTRSPTSPVQSEELPTPVNQGYASQFPGVESAESEWPNGPFLGSGSNVISEAKASGSPRLHQNGSMGRERVSPTRAGGMRQQQQSPGPNHFTPAYHTGLEKDDGQPPYPSALNANGGAQPRRLYANTTPTSYTMPGVHPLTRTPTDTTKVDLPTKQGFYDSPAYWLILYFFFNLGLTLFNKIVLVSFPFPYVSQLCTSCALKLTDRL
jgi:hypothetical protein